MSASVLPQIMMVVTLPSNGRTEAEHHNERSARKQGVDISFFFFFSVQIVVRSCEAQPLCFSYGWGGRLRARSVFSENSGK